MNRDQFIRKLRKPARKQKKLFIVEFERGKGSHCMITFEATSVALQQDLTPGRIERFLKQTGVDRADLS